jgi:hypothetical protein
VVKYGRRVLRTAIGVVATKPRLYRTIRILCVSIPGLQSFVRRRLAATQPKVAPIAIDVEGVITLEGLCHLSRQL